MYDALMPVPALSFATRYYHCSAGIMLTASHNPAEYNGYKAYGSDGCQMTDEAAGKVYKKIQETDVLTGYKTMEFAKAVDEGLIRFVGEDCKEAFYKSVLFPAGASRTLQGCRSYFGLFTLKRNRIRAGNPHFQGNGYRGRKYCAGAGVS